jgi:hypothetical protein
MEEDLVKLRQSLKKTNQQLFKEKKIVHYLCFGILTLIKKSIVKA